MEKYEDEKGIPVLFILTEHRLTIICHLASAGRVKIYGVTTNISSSNRGGKGGFIPAASLIFRVGLATGD
jgi:hypothetical protein